MMPNVIEITKDFPPSRKSSKMKTGSKNDKIDARDLSELLRGGQLQPVYHGDAGVRTLKELARSYMTLTEDVNRVMNRIKAVNHSQAIHCGGPRVYSAHYREEWLDQLLQPGQRRRAEHLHQQFGYVGSHNKSLSAYIIKLAKLGGYLARANDSPPGNMVMWRGMSRLTDIELGATIGAQIVGN